MAVKTLCGVLLGALTLGATPFANHWYQGKAEVAVYGLQQTRYGETRPGSATLIFVTEAFSKQKQVKLDYPDQAGEDHATVLKLNTVKKYDTGIYPYSVMTSAFADISSGQLYKATTSIQEWCGHVFSQANWVEGKQYRYRGFSYFESAGDEDLRLEGAKLTEALMLDIRLGKLTPETTTLQLVPSQETLRTRHIKPEGHPATLSWNDGDEVTTLTIDYKQPTDSLDLQLVIQYNTAFPHAIQGWSESFSKGGKRYTTTATLKTIQMLPYWNMNSSQHDHWPTKIGLRD